MMTKTPESDILSSKIPDKQVIQPLSTIGSAPRSERGDYRFESCNGCCSTNMPHYKGNWHPFGLENRLLKGSLGSNPRCGVITQQRSIIGNAKDLESFLYRSESGRCRFKMPYYKGNWYPSCPENKTPKGVPGSNPGYGVCLCSSMDKTFGYEPKNERSNRSRDTVIVVQRKGQQIVNLQMWVRFPSVTCYFLSG